MASLPQRARPGGRSCSDPAMAKHPSSISFSSKLSAHFCNAGKWPDTHEVQSNERTIDYSVSAGCIQGSMPAATSKLRQNCCRCPWPASSAACSRCTCPSTVSSAASALAAAARLPTLSTKPLEGVCNAAAAGSSLLALLQLQLVPLLPLVADGGRPASQEGCSSGCELHSTARPPLSPTWHSNAAAASSCSG